MKGGVGFYLVGAGVLVALAGCGRNAFMMGEREPWRHQAEVTCLKSGVVKVGTGVVRMEPIEGPGMCGADFPLKVAALGESSSAIGYADDPRPPGAIPNASSQMPRWPISEPRYAPPAAIAPVQAEPLPVQSMPAPHMRWVPGPPPAERPDYRAPAGRPISLSPPGAEPGVTPNAAPLPDDIPEDAGMPPGRARAPYPPQRAYGAPIYQSPPRTPPALGPRRAPQTTAAVGPATLTPPATLACPIVSALDRWVSDGVQPAAMRWFGAPVVEIKQIASYSCRSMVGSGTSHISEHAFGNAIDIAAFTLADGRRISVQEGWHGTPEQQGFLHDVQLAACDNFTTVLAPGYNTAHYNHIHVDLMRRPSGDRPCRPEAIPGEVAAAKARAIYAGRQRGPAYTGSIAKSRRLPAAVPGEDGYILEEDAARGSTPAMHRRAGGGNVGLDDDDSTGTLVPTAPLRARKAIAGDDRLTAH
jgi:Extensin-like protein C-terminus